MTLRAALDHKNSVRGKNGEERRGLLHRHFEQWLDRPTRSITEDDVEIVFEGKLSTFILHCSERVALPQFP
jgi:hypothetical protein